MTPKRTLVCLLALIATFTILYSGRNADASMLGGYPKKFSFTGVVELTYSDYYYKFPSTRTTSEYNSSFFQQTYTLGARGYIYHPRLAVFDARISYGDERQLAATTGNKVNSHNVGYDVRLTFLPYRPISLGIYAGSTDYTTNPEGEFINTLWARDQSINYTYYGVGLKINKPPLPFMRLEYNHQAQDLLGYGNKSGTIQSDEYLLDYRGHLRLWNTVYLGIIQYVDYSSPSVNYKAKIMRLTTTSTIKRGLYLQTSFNYSDFDFSKLLSFSSQLNIDQSQLFKQSYYYNFLQSEELFRGLAQQGVAGQNWKETINSLTGSWLYRFVNGPTTSLALNYGIRDESNGSKEKAKFYGISFSASYGRSFLDLNFSPSYRLIYRKDELKGELFENNLQLDLVTRKVRWGTIYANYALTISHQVDKFREAAEDDFGSGETAFETKTTKVDNITHVLRTGVRGRGPGKRLSRAQWNVQAEVFYSDATIERQQPDFFFDEDVIDTPQTVRFKREIRRYSLLGNVTYPIGWATVFFSAGSSIGESNGASLRKIFYEERVSYPIFRNLYLLVKWRQLWEKIAENPNRRVDEYALSAEYRIGQTTISANGAVLKTSFKGEGMDVRRVYLRLRRKIF